MQNSLEKADIIVNQENLEDFLDQIVDFDTFCFPDSSWCIDVWRGLFDFHPLQVYLSFRQSQPVGYLVLSLLSPDSELLRLGVKESSRRRGIGSHLINRMIHESKNSGVETIFLEVREDNLPARLFYQARGFVITAERKNYYHSPPGSAMILKRCL